MSGVECLRCGEIGQDRRTLQMACFYDMSELEIPLTEDQKTGLYEMRVCKDCRADWLKAIKDWFDEIPSNVEEVGSGIFVRELGGIRELTKEQYQERFGNGKK